MLKVYSYQIPFVTPFRSASLEVKERTGWILNFKEQEASAYAEFSPLPGFGEPDTEGLSYFYDGKKDKPNANTNNSPLHKLESQCRSLLTLPFSEVQEALEQEFTSAGLKFALSALLIQLEAAKRQQSIHNLFDVYSDSPVRVNDVWSLPMATEASSISDVITKTSPLPFQDLIRTKLQQSTSESLTDIKIKADQNFERLKIILRLVSEWNEEMNETVHLKIDFNQSLSWNALATLESSLSEREKKWIRYIEDPVPLSTPAEFSRLRSTTSLPIALDESFTQLYSEYSKALLLEMNSHSIGPIVLKPAQFGSIFALTDFAKTCSSLKLDLVISSMLESSVGRSLTLLVARLFGSPNQSHGLWTGQLFTKDLFEDPVRKELQNSFSKTSIKNNYRSLFPEMIENHPLLTRIF